MPLFRTTYTAETLVKQGIWLYLLLLIFEGALRKWILPGLSNPLLIVRDPLALSVLCLAIYYKLLNWNIYLLMALFISMLAIPSTLIFGHGNFPVTLFGARYLLIHLPFLFLIGAVFDKSDVEQFGRFLLWITPFMTLLIALQFYSPQSAWVNRGIGGSELGSGFSGAMGYYRPSAVFSFTSGTSTFFSLAAVYVVYFWFSKAYVQRILLLVASVGVLIAIPLSISRAYFFQFLLTIAFGLCVSLRSPQVLFQVALAILLMLVAYVALNQFDFFHTSTTVFMARFEGASNTEGGLKGVLGNRFLGELYYALTNATENPFWGRGLGAGTNTGQRLLGVNHLMPVISTEGEWNRMISEVGPFLGLLIVGLRVGLGVSLLLKSWQAIRLDNVLPWILLSLGFLQITISNWAQPTSLGFFVVLGGLVVASFKETIPTTLHPSFQELEER